MNKSLFLLLLTLIITFSGQAQILDPQEGELFVSEPPFRQSFIRDNKIKAIRGTVSLKSPLKSIVELGLIQEFEFDEEGRVTYTMESAASGESKDTVIAVYEYNDQGLLTTLHGSDLKGYFAYDYTYDANDQVISQVYYREENEGSGKRNFKAGKRFRIAEEKFEYQKQSELALKKRYLNNEERPYKDLVTMHNEYGHVVEKDTRFVVTNRRNTLTYSYDDINRLSRLEDFSNITDRNILIYDYTYDDIGNLEQEALMRNGEKISTRSMLYDQRMFLDVQLIKDEKTEDITIIRYTYEFFE